jgi:protein-tyrosine phosphatase
VIAKRPNEIILADPWSQPNVLNAVSVPEAFYWVIESPTPLAGMRDPRWSGVDWAELSAHGFDCVACLSATRQSYDPSPLTTACCVELEDLASGGIPANPGSERRRINEAARKVSGEPSDGRGVVVHCLGGIGRTGTVLAATLVHLGLEPAAAIEHVIALNAARCCDWPESKWHLTAVQQ